MKFVFETVAESQKDALTAAGAFTDNLLVVIERLTQLNIEVSRSAFEKSSELALVCLNGYLSKENPFVRNSFSNEALGDPASRSDD